MSFRSEEKALSDFDDSTTTSSNDVLEVGSADATNTTRPRLSAARMTLSALRLQGPEAEGGNIRGSLGKKLRLAKSAREIYCPDIEPPPEEGDEDYSASAAQDARRARQRPPDRECIRKGICLALDPNNVADYSQGRT